ncbi:hypothetical protein ACSAZK_15195 [Methanosarcina sp. Mfa9]|uniref:hypothetical protein n=1 Tax=Methanosarcina sp. Mfa9 TaxID=3439063 RepID=UPI003F855D23
MGEYIVYPNIYAYYTYIYILWLISNGHLIRFGHKNSTQNPRIFRAEAGYKAKIPNILKKISEFFPEIERVGGNVTEWYGY